MRCLSMRGKRGFTAVETLVAITIVSLAGLTMVTVLTHGISCYSKGASTDAAVGDATIAVQKLTYDIRDGRSASVSNGVLTVTFPKKLTDPTTGDTIYDLSSEDPVPRTYYLSGSELIRSVDGVNTVMARNVSSVTFGASGGTVNFNLEISCQSGSKTAEKSIDGRVTLRNYRY